MEGQNKKWYYSPSSTGKRIYNAGLLHKLSTHKISDICGLYYQVKIPRGFVDQFLNQPQIFTRMRLSRPMHCFAQSINNQIWECFQITFNSKKTWERCIHWRHFHLSCHSVDPTYIHAQFCLRWQDVFHLETKQCIGPSFYALWKQF